MSLSDQIQKDLVTAMKARDEVRTRTLRMALTSVANEEVAGRTARDLTDADVEVVPMKSRPARELPTPQTAKKSWADLGERIMKVTAL